MYKTKNIEKVFANANVRRLFINVDMVNGFINEGAMHDESIARIIPEQVRIIDECKNHGDRLIFIKEAHSEDSAEFAKFPKHCVKGTREAEIVDELRPYVTQNNVYEKNSTSAIFAKDFLKDISQMFNLKEVVIMGCCTDICVMNLALPLSNFFDEINRKVNIVIPRDAVETYNAPSHEQNEYNEMAFKLMKQAGIEVVEHYATKTPSKQTELGR